MMLPHTYIASVSEDNEDTVLGLASGEASTLSLSTPMT